MKEYFKIAWRNLWRNKRRTILTILSVFFAVFLALLMRSMQLGSYKLMIETAVKNSTGYIQIHAKGYWDDKTINNTLLNSPGLEEKVSQTENVTQIIPRLESFALASSGEQTKGVALTGTDVIKEAEITGLDKKVIKGRYLEPGDQGVLMAEKVAEYLQLDVNDSVVLLSQGYHGISATGLYPVIGIVRFSTPEMNNNLVYMDLPAAQYFYAADNRITSISVMLDDPENMNETFEEISAIDPEKYEVMTWKEMLVEIVQGIEGDNISGLFMLGILYLVVGFGIFGTVMMMTMERKREFGIMVAVGMRKAKLAFIIFIETVIIGLIGIASGIIGSIPLIAYFRVNPIQLTGEAAQAMLEYNMEPVMPFLMDSGFFINQGITVVIITLLTTIYPLMTIKKLKVVSAIAGK